jgi:hypothetical protein
MKATTLAIGAIASLLIIGCVTTTTTAPDGTVTETQAADPSAVILAGELARGYQRRKELEITHGK